MLEVLVYDRDADLYSKAIARALPETRVLAATDESTALNGCIDAEVLVALAHMVSDRLVDRMPRLRFIQALTSGTDHLATLSLPRGTTVASMRGIHGPQMAEVAFLYMIALSRKFTAMQANQRQKRWERWPQRLLFEKTVVFVGVGAISEDIASRTKAFGMRVIGVSDARSSAPGFDELMPRRDLRVAAARADFLIVLAPLTAATRCMIDASVMAAMNPGAVLINLARGPVIDEVALIEALRSGRLAGAGLDVFDIEPLPADSPFWSMPNVIVTPRIGGMSDIYVEQALPLVIENLAAWKTDGAQALRNRVDLEGGTAR